MLFESRYLTTLQLLEPAQVQVGMKWKIDRHCCITESRAGGPALEVGGGTNP